MVPTRLVHSWLGTKNTQLVNFSPFSRLNGTIAAGTQYEGTTNQLTARFVTDDSVTYPGFSITYSQTTGRFYKSNRLTVMMSIFSDATTDVTDDQRSHRNAHQATLAALQMAASLHLTTRMCTLPT